MYDQINDNIGTGLTLDMAFPPHAFMFQHHHEDSPHNLISPPSLPTCPSQFFHGGGGNYMMMNRGMAFTGGDQTQKSTTLNGQEEAEEDMSDEGSQMLGEKKKRLNIEQVRALEKSFEVGNKLEPERKIQLAKALGLQPRQIAIWFQNRRARWKTKQLEKDYDSLKKQFDVLQADNDLLHAQNKKLSSELRALKNSEGNTKREAEGSWSNNASTENSSDIINLDMSRTQAGMIKDLFPSSIRSTSTANQIDNHHSQMVREDNFCNMFNGIDETTSATYWAWPDQQHHHSHGHFN